jgi:hypothetical protein
MNFINKKRDCPFTQIDNDLIKNPNLSWQAKGVLSYLISLPQNWIINIKDIENRATNGRDSVARCISELELNGYIKKKKIQNQKGQFAGWEYEYSDIPIYLETENGKTENGKTENGKTENGKTENGKTATINKENTNKDLKNKDFTNKEGEQNFENLFEVEEEQPKQKKVATKKIKSDPQNENPKICENPLVYHHNSNEYIKVFNEYLEHRQTIKKPLKINLQKQKLLDHLKEYCEEYAIILLNNSILNGWQGVIFAETKNNYQKWISEQNPNNLTSQIPQKQIYVPSNKQQQSFSSEYQQQQLERIERIKRNNPTTNI